MTSPDTQTPAPRGWRPKRRHLLAAGAGAGFASVGGVTAWAAAIEPRFLLEVASHELTLPSWTAPPTRIALLTDFHACEPWMPVERIAEIVERTNALAPDLVLLGGDYVASLGRWKLRNLEPTEWAEPLGSLRAPLGVFSVLGNHDWWADPGPVIEALERVGIPVLENDAVRIGGPDGFWLTGLGDQLPQRGGWGRGVDDLPGTMAQIRDDRPVILLAHEPDIFVRVDARVSVTLAGHTHGGQVRLPGIGPLVVPSQFGARFVHGHIVERDRHLVVSAGLGVTGLPVRFGVPPEITMITLLPARA